MNFKKWMVACMAALFAGILFFVADAGHAEAEHDHEYDADGHEHAGEACTGHDDAGTAHVEAEAEHADAADSAHADEAHDDGTHDDEAGDRHDEGALLLTPEQRGRFNLVVTNAGPGTLRNEIRLMGAVSFDEDRLAHLTPRVAGVVQAIHKTVGDSVKAGEVMAVIESREVAEAKADYLAAKARSSLAEKIHRREQTLREQKISSEQELLDAEQTLAEARIALRLSEQKLHAIGLPESAVAALDEGHDDVITHYEIGSPIDGVVTSKHIALGESLAADADIFTVADLSSVWINLAVHTRDLNAVRKGDEVLLRSVHDGADARGRVAMVTPFVDEATRSATARVVVDNDQGRWVPGTFATGFIAESADELSVVVPRGAVQNIEGRDVVFVEHEGAFEMAPVALGRSDSASVEIISGLASGTPYVSEGAFQLKAVVVTSALDSHAGHGH